MSTEVEQWLNTKYGVESALYQDLSRLITLGVKEGWAADTEIAGPRYRRSQLAVPCAETFFFSATAVLMDSTDNTQNNPEGSFRGGYHLHPYGELILVVPLDEGCARRSERLVLWRLDGTGAGKPSLPGSQGRRCHLAHFFARRTDSVRRHTAAALKRSGAPG